MKKRILSTLLVLCMVLGMLPLEAFAAESEMFAEPKVTGLTVSFGGETPIDLLHDQPAISMPEGSKPVFTITFDSVELLDRVFVTSTKDGETKYLEATPKGGQYVTADYFDPIDTNYIPGTISVTYSKKTVNVNENGDLGSTNINTLKTQLTAQGISIRRETTNADGTVTAEIVLGDLFGAMSDVYFDAAVSEFMAGAGIDQGELNKWLGVYQNLSQLSSYDLESADGKNFTLYLGDGNDFGDSDTYLMLVKDATSNKYTKMLLSKAADKAGLGDIADTLSAANLASKVLLDYSAISKDTAVLREEVNTHPTMTSQEKAEANAKITALDHDKKLFMMGMTAIPFFLNPVGAPLMISALIAGYSSIADYFWDYRIGMIQGCPAITNVFNEDSDHGAGWIPLTNEFLKNNRWAIQESGNYYLAEDISSLYIGNPDEDTVAQLNVTLCFHGHTISSYSGIRNVAQTVHLKDCRYMDSDIENLYGSVAVSNEGGTLTISNCCIGGITNYSGTITLNNCRGMFEVTNQSGTINISGATILTKVYNSGTLNISGGEIINTKDRGYAIFNRETGEINFSNGIVENTGTGQTSCLENFGKVTITNGTFKNSGASASDYCIYNHTDGEVIIKNGAVNSVGGFGCAINNDGRLTIRGGMVTSNATSIDNCGELTLSGGRIESIGIETNSGCNSIVNSGTMTMNGGTVKADGVAIYDNMYDGISNESDGILQINGGILQAERALTNWGKTVITHGTILGCISNHYNDAIIFSIGGTSVIELKNDDMVILSSGSELPIIKADIGYTGGITYFDDLNPEGVRSTIDNAAEIDFITCYLRIEGDDAANDSPNPCEHEYTPVVTPPTCTARGYTTYTCSLCGKTYTDNYVSALGHSYGRWVIVQEATETRTGLRERSCGVCGNVQSETIPKLDPKPSEPVENPSKPEKPAEKPAEPEKPSEPEEPVQPETPVQPQEPVVSVPVYDDVAANSWYSEAAAYVASKGLMMGTSENNFSPDAQMTRAMIWTVLGRMDGADVSSASGAWYTGAQAWSVEKGVSDGTNPNGSITRQELVTMLWRYMGSPAAAADLTVFADSADVAGWAVGAIEWAVSSGIIQGSGNALNPAGTATRAEAAALLMRFCENVQ